MAKDSANSTTRFSSRVEAYVKYRPGYPAGMYELFRKDMSLGPASIVADVGSGTGISAETLLIDGCTVYCVEPNADMRGAAERMLGKYPGFRSINGTGEQTTLLGSSVDLAFCAQAFHWLDHQRAADEFRRIVRPGGFIVIAWNKRRSNTSPFLSEYDQLLVRYGTDYTKVAHDKSPLTLGDFERLAGVPFQRAAFANEQRFDLEGLRGRVASSSYTPLPGEPGYAELYTGLDKLFGRYASDGQVVFEYETEVFIGRM
jgi:SAM-dependent methyltransferase